ncbi:hypothetical protein BDV27DRAFT_145142 [Aspergillus caelatus]|uniref:Uncharacterized protein n=1 Tax=Aspergillus caelatus TaxID=61420 RepID=A0A5N7A4M7_9EURO|nr:uncharacterized protein BDV27DRAFT_145142 [Aspergillus caelatus]KAE8364635.1 hypothetical protein BDV27DRAFT_145142 [Aspergillus caelatus]
MFRAPALFSPFPSLGNDRDNLLRPVNSHDEQPESSTLSESQAQRLIDTSAAPSSLKQPSQGRQLRSNKWQLIFDILSAISALPFVALALVAIVYNSRSVDERDWDDLQIAMKTSVTVFPLIFSAVIGRAIRQIAKQNLERGSTLGRLEQLSKSTTVFGAISTPLMLKSWNILALVLVLIWLVSPLGGQASLYLISPQSLEHVELQEVQYLDINGLSKAPNLTSFPRLTDALEAVFLACLIAPVSVKEADSDAWGNVKIPLLRSLVRNNTAQSEGWFEPAGNKITHSSLIGVPMFGISSRGNSTFQLQTSYIDTDCYELGEAPDELVYKYNGQNGQFRIYPAAPWNVTRSVNASVAPDIHVLSGYGKEATNGALITCHVTNVYVELEVLCSGSNTTAQSQRSCRVTAIRESVEPHQSSSMPPLMYPDFSVWDTFAQGLVNASLLVNRKLGTYTEAYLQNVDVAETLPLPKYLLKTPLNDISDHLTQIMNTFYLGSIALPFVTLGPNLPSQGNYSKYSEAYEAFDRSSLASVQAERAYRDATATYVANWGWVVVLLLASLMLIGASVVSFWVGRQSLNPDIIGYASTLTRDAPYLRLPSAASTLSGFERARWLKDVRVRFGDVQPEDTVGRLAISTPDLAGRSRKGRLYL